MDIQLDLKITEYLFLLKRTTLGLGVLLLSSCASWNSIHRSGDLDDDNSSYVSIDAKQRLMITGKRAYWDGNKYASEPNIIICNEPSPDVFSVYTAALGADISKSEELTAALKLTTGESGASIGIRTQSIQLLRDAMYRICEAYLSGALEPTEYFRLLASYQKSMVTLIAIEQLTGAAKPAQVILKASSNLQDNGAASLEAKKTERKAFEELEKLNDEKASIDARIAKVQEELDNDADKKCSAKQSDLDENIKQFCEEFSSAIGEKNKLEVKIELAEKEHKDWLKVLSETTSSNNLSSSLEDKIVSASGVKMDADTVVALAEKVRDLVTDVFRDELVVACIELISGQLNGGPDFALEESIEATDSKRDSDRDYRKNAKISGDRFCTNILERAFAKTGAGS